MRDSRTVLREAEGETPAAYLPAKRFLPLAQALGSRALQDQAQCRRYARRSGPEAPGARPGFSGSLVTAGRRRYPGWCRCGRMAAAVVTKLCGVAETEAGVTSEVELHLLHITGRYT